MALATTSLKDPFVPRRSGRIALVKRHRFNNNNSGVPSGSTSSCFYHHASTVGRKRSNKSVHFSQDIEQVRLFSQSDTPVELQATTASRLEFQNWSPTIPSPPSSLSSASARRRYSRKPDATVCLENLELRGNMNDFSLCGTCRVANLAFEKHVLVRYTTDDWQTFHDVEARFQASIHGGAWDRFAFDLKLVGPNYQGQRQHHILQLAIRYAVNNCHFWDNNDGKDYRIAVIPDSGRQSNHPSSPTSWSLSSYFWQHVAKSLQ